MVSSFASCRSADVSSFVTDSYFDLLAIPDSWQPVKLKTAKNGWSAALRFFQWAFPEDSSHDPEGVVN